MKPKGKGDGAPIIIIKKKKGHAAHHGGAWKVAYADFVTAMMALFMVLWLLAQSDQTMREQLSEYFRTGVFSGAPAVLNGGSGLQDKAFLEPKKETAVALESAQLDDAAQLVRAELAKLVAADPQLESLNKQIDVRVTEQGLLVQIIDGGDDLLYDLSSAALKPRLIAVLKKLGPILGKLDNRLQVHGHTDARPFPEGSERSNWSLSFERADNARSVLEATGIREGQVAGVYAHGSTQPVVKKNPLDPANRRLAILAMRRGFEKETSTGVIQPLM
jgi:chemotaxis protein MotB